jgi:predicted SnoaL-like aldol condensation-catalyzing enzyme
MSEDSWSAAHAKMFLPRHIYLAVGMLLSKPLSTSSYNPSLRTSPVEVHPDTPPHVAVLSAKKTSVLAPSKRSTNMTTITEGYRKEPIAINDPTRGKGGSTRPDRIEVNKRTVINFYDLLFNEGKTVEAVERYVGDGFIHHNASDEKSREAFIQYFEQMARDYPGKRVQFKWLIAEHNYVALHCRQHWPQDQDYVGMNIFRLDHNGRIVEHWDVLQAVPPVSVSQGTGS